MIDVSEAFRSTYPGARLGVLAMAGVTNPPVHPELERRKAEVEREVRERYGSLDREQLRRLPVMQAYGAYYGRFDKLYHLLAQVESVARKGRALPSVAALVEAMFMAEIRNMLLTAGHDLDRLVAPLTLGVASGDERYLGIQDKPQTCIRDDMSIADGQGVISSVLRGPDHRTRIVPETTRALFTVYAPAGITEEALLAHLREIEGHVRLVSPQATTSACEVR
jgi:DNA/RNA-binding domain of Phe-tRNA-synthetase-like protein